MKSIEIKELKELQLEILSSVHCFCKQNGIHYSLAYGTLLGAIRHRGYIPWDDDIDIMMLRQDYERFIRIFNGHFTNLSICAPELDLDYYAPYANIWDNRTIMYEGTPDHHRGKQIGVKIDVFPIDVSSNNKLDRFVSRFLYLLWCSYRYRGTEVKGNLLINIRNRFVGILANLLGYRRIQKLIIQNSKKYFGKKSEVLGLRAFSNRNNLNFNFHDFDSYTEIEFEDRYYSSVVGIDDYLKSNYGDYMELPPVEKRVANHNFVAYWK